MSITAGARFGSYEIINLVGAGGMGEVYKALDTRLQRTVAIKVLPDAFSTDEERLARFEREARTLASLNHPNVAQIYGLEDATSGARRVHALTMEFVAGEDLAARLARGPLAMEDAVAISRQLVDALEAAHELGIVHRDLKPSNIKVRPDAPSRCWTLVSPRRWSRRRCHRGAWPTRQRSPACTHMPGSSWARPPTCRPNRRRGESSIAVPTSGPLAWCYTSSSRARVPLARTTRPRSSRA